MLGYSRHSQVRGKCARIIDTLTDSWKRRSNSIDVYIKKITDCKRKTKNNHPTLQTIRNGLLIRFNASTI